MEEQGRRIQREGRKLQQRAMPARVSDLLLEVLKDGFNGLGNGGRSRATIKIMRERIKLFGVGWPSLFCVGHTHANFFFYFKILNLNC